MHLDVRSQGTCAKPISEARLAHPFLDVILLEDMLTISTNETLSRNVTLDVKLTEDMVMTSTTETLGIGVEVSLSKQ